MTESGSDGRAVRRAFGGAQDDPDRLLRRLDGALSAADAEGRYDLVGSRRLAQRSHGPAPEAWEACTHTSRLAAMLRDGERITVTFSAETASRHNIELLSSRHPWCCWLWTVRCGPRHPQTVRVVGCPRLTEGRRYAVRLDLVTTTGLRPRAGTLGSARSTSRRESQPRGGDTALDRARRRDTGGRALRGRRVPVCPSLARWSPRSGVASAKSAPRTTRQWWRDVSRVDAGESR